MVLGPRVAGITARAVFSVAGAAVVSVVVDLAVVVLAVEVAASAEAELPEDGRIK